MTIIEDTLAAATDPYGDRRFWPKGQHPATYRDRIVADRLRRILAITEERLEDHRRVDARAAIDYHERRVAEFEAVEATAKQQYIRAVLRP